MTMIIRLSGIRSIGILSTDILSDRGVNGLMPQVSFCIEKLF